MLKFLRKKTKVIVWSVVVAFIAWGGYAVSLQFEVTQRSPGRIFGQEISFRDFLLASRAVQIFTPAADRSEPPSPEEIEARTWEFLILSREAKHRKIQASDEEVRQEIIRLLGNGKAATLTGEAYAQWVRANLREEPREFERQLREHLRIRKLLAEVRKELGAKPERKLRQWLKELFSQAGLEVYRPPSAR